MIDFTNRHETFFITYEDVIKSPSITIMRNIIEKYYDYYKEFINLKLFSYMKTPEEFFNYFILRPHKNIFRCLYLKEFDFDSAWKDIYNRNPKLYIDSEELKFGSAVHVMKVQKFISRIYIWTEEYDTRIHFDLNSNYNMHNISYMTGPFLEVIKKIPPVTCYVLNDLEYLKLLLTTDKLTYTEIIVPEYGYNYINLDDMPEFKIKDLNKLALDKVFKLSTFSPM